MKCCICQINLDVQEKRKDYVSKFSSYDFSKQLGLQTVDVSSAFSIKGYNAIRQGRKAMKRSGCNMALNKR